MSDSAHGKSKVSLDEAASIEGIAHAFCIADRPTVLVSSMTPSAPALELIRSHLIVLTRLGAPKHVHFAHALGPGYVVRPTRDWIEFDSTLSREHIDVAVIDPIADSIGPGGRAADRRSQAGRWGAGGAYSVPSIPFILYLDVSPPAMRSLVELVRLGAFGLLIRGADDDEASVRSVVDAAASSGYAAKVLAYLDAPVGRLPQALAGAIRSLFVAPERVTSAEQLAHVAGLTRRSLDRWLARAGLASARHLVSGARVLAAYARTRGRQLDQRATAETVGVWSPRSWTRQVRSVTGYAPSTVWRAVDAHQMVLLIAERMRRPALSVEPEVEGRREKANDEQSGKLRPRTYQKEEGTNSIAD